MGPQSEGRPSNDGRTYASMPGAFDDNRYQQSREPDTIPSSYQLGRPSLAFENKGNGSTSVSTNGRERDLERPKTSEERERNNSRHRSSRKGSGQLRICKKCSEPLTGQFVRALGGTFHLDCFKCRVS